MKLLLSDRRLAIIPLRLEEPQLEFALVVHESPLLHALATLFDLFWAQAVPVGLSATAAEAETEGGDRLSDEDDRLLVLLSAGIKDEAIARQLGVGLRTVARRVRRLMDLFGVQTRFQLGRAVERGPSRSWLGGCR